VTDDERHFLPTVAASYHLKYRFGDDEGWWLVMDDGTEERLDMDDDVDG